MRPRLTLFATITVTALLAVSVPGCLSPAEGQTVTCPKGYILKNGVCVKGRKTGPMPAPAPRPVQP